jgi:hypothetical protein
MGNGVTTVCLFHNHRVREDIQMVFMVHFEGVFWNMVRQSLCEERARQRVQDSMIVACVLISHPALLVVVGGLSQL